MSSTSVSSCCKSSKGLCPISHIYWGIFWAVQQWSYSSCTCALRHPFFKSMAIAYSDSMWFRKQPSQFSMGQTAQSITCSIMEKPHAGLDDCLNMLLSCFRKRMSVRPQPIVACNLTVISPTAFNSELSCPRTLSCLILVSNSAKSSPMTTCHLDCINSDVASDFRQVQ